MEVGVERAWTQTGPAGCARPDQAHTFGMHLGVLSFPESGRKLFERLEDGGGVLCTNFCFEISTLA